MLNYLRVKQVCWAWLGCLWTATAYAAQATFAGDLSTIPPAAIVISAILATIGGAAFTAQKIASPDVIVKHIAAEIVKDILASIVAGLVTFFVCSWLGFAAVLQAACITIAGYGGSRVLERYLNSGLMRIDSLGGEKGPQ